MMVIARDPVYGNTLDGLDLINSKNIMATNNIETTTIHVTSMIGQKRVAFVCVDQNGMLFASQKPCV